MSSVFVYVGLDYHQDSIRVCVLGEDGVERFNRDVPNDVVEVWSRVADFGVPKVLAIEACSGAADFAEQLREKTEWTVQLADPGAVRAMKRGPDKTDRGDAFWLADLARVDHLPEVWLPDAVTRDLRKLVRYRKQLTEMRRRVKQHIRGLLADERALAPPANAWTKAWKAWLLESAPISEATRWIIVQQFTQLEQLEPAIRAVEMELERLTVNDTETQRLLGHKGIGLVTAVTLRAELGTFTRFGSGKQVSRYCGTTPCNRSSGRRQADAGLVKACNSDLRVVTLEAAHRISRWDPKWKKLKTRLVKKGKPRNVATAAVANRWLRWLYHQMVTIPRLAAV